MATISAAMVKELRESTGAGMMDCKAALTETSGDMTAAQDWLRKKGLSKAAKKADRVAAEGLVAALTGDKTGVVVFPSGPKGSVPYSVTSWGLSLAAGSKNKDAAWEFVKWATSKEIVLKTQGAARGPEQDGPAGVRGQGMCTGVAQEPGRFVCFRRPLGFADDDARCFDVARAGRLR